MLEVVVPETCAGERRWILDTILGDFLGLEFECHARAVETVFIRQDGRTLEVTDVFLRNASGRWLDETSLPEVPLDIWDLTESGLELSMTDSRIPVLFGRGELARSDNQITLELDVFGSAFFMLSRYEEIVQDTRDKHDRFPASASVASRSGFLQRPIVNEYTEILWGCMHRLWPQLQRKRHEFRNWVTADVDHPYSAGTRSAVRQLRQIGADLLLRRSFTKALDNTRNYFYSKRGNYECDPYYPLLAWMMDANERAGNAITFFMMAGATNPRRDNGYSINEPIVREVLRSISTRGHDFGLHPSYETYDDGAQLRREVDNLKRALSEEGITVNSLGGRQHYLRWSAPGTARHYRNAGLEFDASLGYADQSGFRCGTCYEYSFYDAEKRCSIPLIVRPLVVMEGTLFSAQYMNLDVASGTKFALQLKDNCRLFGGTFSLLWHNSSFLTPWAEAVYQELID